MISRVLSAHYHLPMLACAGLLIFVAVFAATLVWVFRKGSDATYREIQEIPLRESP